MELRHKILLLSLLPLVLVVLAVGWAVQRQSQQLVQEASAALRPALMASKETELRHYVGLARSALGHLYDSGRDDPAAKAEARELLAALDYGVDGYFFLYDFAGNVLMHPRQPELVGRNLWALRDAQGRPTIQQLIERARAGGGTIEYPWPKPSTHASEAPKLGYVIALERWGWMLGTGIYLDDVQAALDQVQREVAGNAAATQAAIAAIALCGVLLVAVFGLALNLSQRRFADARLRRLAERVVHSQEDERARVARELHDGLSQQLVAVKFVLESAAARLADPAQPRTAAAAPLGSALGGLQQALGELRGIAQALRPRLLDDLGLDAALERLGRDTAASSGLQVSVRADSGGAVPDVVATALFRIAQEACANTVRHAAARTLLLALNRHRDGLLLHIEDDGHGFDAGRLLADGVRDDAGGFGLRNMHERLEALGGRFELHTAPGQGCRLDAHIPRRALRLSGGP
ncbi:cache domain-containing protein [Plasticicumulans acidivorans]|uniref:Signal transduction histidine kinase n=1 Tax=Plasticicumulans acidivorans TaxID=886464 RepID=A0A317MRH4_9GAMM|nr:cache domain-containing protein [Plasticicumulans acidivorans]PWV58888.1 signal transduction histidine kinase [Plasticicumulans acidivorans]